MRKIFKTHAIGRHLITVPADAELIESWKYDKDRLELSASIDDAYFNQLIARREAELRRQVQKSGKSSFIERVALANQSTTVISWAQLYDEKGYSFDTYIRAGKAFIRDALHTSIDRKKEALAFFSRCSEKWREIPADQIPEGIGFVVGNTMIADDCPNYESWRLLIRLADKPDVTLEVSGYVGAADEGLRKRAGGTVASMLGMAMGLTQLRNHARPVGPIDADEILVAGTQNGKRCYGFKWEAPGKDYSLAEPNLNVSLEVRESAYATNRESFSSDDEALELWDTLVNSIRLRPGAV